MEQIPRAQYHVALPVLIGATQEYGSLEQQQVLDELAGHNRLFDIHVLRVALAE
jgi:hypothetical protein